MTNDTDKLRIFYTIPNFTPLLEFRKCVWREKNIMMWLLATLSSLTMCSVVSFEKRAVYAVHRVVKM